MTKTQTLLAVAAVTWISGGAAEAQVAEHPMVVRQLPAGPPTTIEALVAKALVDAPSIKAAWARVDAAKGMLTQASARAGVELMTERRDEYGGMNHQTAIGVSWPLEIGRRQARVNVGIDQAAQTALGATEQARQVAARVRVAAIRALAAERLLALTAQTVESHHQWCDLLAERVKVGTSSPLDRDMADIELKMGQASLAKMRGEADARWAELKAAAGLDPATPLTLTESLEEAVLEMRKAKPAAMADAVDDRPDVAMADAAIEIADAKAELARKEGGLDLRLGATYMRTAAGFPQMVMGPGGAIVPIENRMNEFAITATVMLPWPKRREGMVATALAEKKAAEWDREALLFTARAEASAAEARDREAGKALEIYADGLLELSAKNLDVIRQSFDLGRVSRAEVSAEERRYREVQSAYVAALQEAYEARVMWTQALGGTR